MAQRGYKQCQELFLNYESIKNSNVQAATLLIGHSSSGKTTLFELFKKFIANVQDQNLKLNEKGVYQYQNVINQKSLKIGTISPAIFTIKKQTFVDVPVLIYQAQAKKWNSIQQAITLSGVFRAFKKVRFVILIDQKFTQTKINVWKKGLQNIVDYIDQNKLTDWILNSFSIIITKSSKVNQIAGINRLESLIQLLIKQSTPQKQQIYKKIVTNIKQNKRVQVFKKTVPDQEQNKKNIKQIYQDVIKYPFCQINSDLLIQKIKVEEHSRTLLNQQFNQLKGVLKFWGSVLQWLFLDKNYQKSQNFKTQKKINYPTIDINPKIIENQKQQFQKSYQKSIKNKDSFTNIVSVSELMFDIIDLLTTSAQGKKTSYLKSFVGILEKYGLIKDQEQSVIHKILLFYGTFQEVVGNVIQWDFLQYFQQNFKFLQNQEIITVMKSYFLDDCYKLAESPELCKKISQILERYFQGNQPVQNKQKQKYQNIKISCSMVVINEGNIKQSLRTLFQIFLSYQTKFQNDQKLLVQFYAQLGKLLIKANKSIKAASLLKKGGHLWSAIQAYQKSIVDKQLSNQQDALKYIQLVSQIPLKEETIKVYLQLSHMIISNLGKNKVQQIIEGMTKGQYQISSKTYQLLFGQKRIQRLTKEETKQIKMLIESL